MAGIATRGRKWKHCNDPFLKCSHCFEPYDNGDHQAKFLSCLHIFCKSCLNDNAGNRSSFNCQVCEKKIDLQDGTVDDLPDNFLVAILQQQPATSCGNCNRGNLAVQYCRECHCFQCIKCVENHSTLNSLKNHTLQPMADALQNQAHHQDHDRAEFESAAREIKISSLRVKDRHKELQKRKESLEKVRTELTTNFRKHEEQIQKAKKALHDLIDLRCSRAQSNLERLYNEEHRQLTEQILAMESVAFQMTSACEFTDRACDVTPPELLQTYQDKFTDRLQELKNAELPKVISKPIEFAFTSKHHSSMKEIQESLDSICDTNGKHQVDSSESYVESSETPIPNLQLPDCKVM